MAGRGFAVLAFFTSLMKSSLGIHLHDRDLNAPLRDSYDYIVVGCGISGLVVANRLSEDDFVNVLCVEAGLADQYEAIIQDPVYVGADIGGQYDWLLETTPQLQLDGGTRPMPQGKVLGGGSILNAMVWNRGGQDDFNAWAALGNPGWDWEGILPYFIKSETYTPVYSEAIAEAYSINYNPAVHGTEGPVQVSYPKYFYPQSINLFAAINYLGVPTEFDPQEGRTAGAAFCPTDLDPNNQTRSDARRTYYDPFATRENFHVITGQQVTRVLIEGILGNAETDEPTSGGNNNGEGGVSVGTGSSEGLGFGPSDTTPGGSAGNGRFATRQTTGVRITGVEFAATAASPRQTIYATREVIVAAGALHSAQLLQLSGFGPASLLELFNISVVIDLPGVGNNLQDHPLVGTFYPYNNISFPDPAELTTNATFNAIAEAEYETNKTGPWTAGAPNGLAFIPLALASNNTGNILDNAAGQAPTDYLAAGLDTTIVAGYTAQKLSLVTRLADPDVAAWEIINNNAGSLTVSIMHPFSRGTCYINSANPFEPPLIDPRWLSNPVDRQILIEALLFNREILAAPPMLELQAAQFVPPIDADEAALDQVINNGIRTEFHPSGTCAMLPIEQGGVVDSHLRVYGAQNLRVVDAGIFPLVPAAHLQAVVYGVAEKAADIIKADNVQPDPVVASLLNTTNGTASTTISIGSALFNTSTVTTASSSLATFGPYVNTTSTRIGPLQSSPQTSNSSSSIATNRSKGVSVIAPTSSLSFVTASLILSSTPSISSSSSNSDVEPSSLLSSNSLSLITDSSSAITILSIVEASIDLSMSVLTSPTSSSTAFSISSSVFSVSIAAYSSSSTTIPAIEVSFTQAPNPSAGLEATTSIVPTVTVIRVTTTPSASLLDASSLSSAVISVLPSEGLPSAAISSLVPVIVGTTFTSSAAPVTSGTASAISTSNIQAEEEQMAIEAFIQWLLNYFHLN